MSKTGEFAFLSRGHDERGRAVKIEFNTDGLADAILARLRPQMDRPGEGRWPAAMSRIQAAEYLSVSERTVSNLVEQGRLRRVRIAGCVRFRREDLDQLIDAGVE